MRTQNEIDHEDMDRIEFSIYDSELDLTARQLVDRGQFMSLDSVGKDEIRRKCYSVMNSLLDQESKKC